MSNRRFEIRFHPGALKEYQNLDNSAAEMVDKALEELEYRADEVGKTLRNNNDTKLAGCKEIKLRGVGIRIIYRITNEIVDVLKVVYVLAIERRSSDFVFKLANSRYKILKSIPKGKLEKHLGKQSKWKITDEKD